MRSPFIAAGRAHLIGGIGVLALALTLSFGNRALAVSPAATLLASNVTVPAGTTTAGLFTLGNGVTYRVSAAVVTTGHEGVGSMDVTRANSGQVRWTGTDSAGVKGGGSTTTGTNLINADSAGLIRVQLLSNGTPASQPNQLVLHNPTATAVVVRFQITY